MKADDQFAAWLAQATLRSADEEVQAIFLEELVNEAQPGEDLETALARSERSERRAGDFGMEILGTVLISLLLNVGKQVWAAYTKRLAEKAGEQLADATIAAVKTSFRATWSGPEGDAVRQEFVQRLRAAGEKQGLQKAQIEKLVRVIQDERFAQQLQAA